MNVIRGLVTALLLGNIASALAAGVNVKDDSGTITLSNSLVEVVVSPAQGMYVKRATDLVTQKTICTDLKLNFPYFEHGIKTNQSAGYRIIRAADGAVTVAMDMRFGHHRTPEDIKRYGRFAERSLNEFVTVRPDDASFHFRGRVENPTPLRRSSRLWDRALMPLADDLMFIMPVSHGVEHAALWIKPWPRWECDDKLVDFSLWRNWKQPVRTPTQYFGLWCEYGFFSAYYAGDDLNRVRINDRMGDPGMKVYAAGAFELWGGTTPIFEDPGQFVEGFEPTELTKTFYAARGIGPVSYATKDLAVHVETGDKPTIAITGPVRKRVAVDVLVGKELTALGEGDIGPGKIARFALSKSAERFVLQVRNEPALADVPLTVLLKQEFPLKISDHAGLYEKARAACDQKTRIDYIELQEHSNHTGMPVALSASGAAAGLLKNESKDLTALVSICNACYRIGDFDSAAKLADAILRIEQANQHAHHVKGLIAYENGQGADAARFLAKSGDHGLYVLALIGITRGQIAEATAQLRRLVAARPRAIRPRLLLARLSARQGDMEKAVAMAQQAVAENPASPEAFEVLARVAHSKPEIAPMAAEARDQLLRNNPDAQRQLGLLIQELDKGQWVYPARYRLPLPEAKP
jgi:tetratricopeptide (TPR) repeat protein